MSLALIMALAGLGVPPASRAQTFDAQPRWPDVVVARVLSIEDGFDCRSLGVEQRIDLEIEEVFRGNPVPGERVAVVEPGGFVHPGDRHLSASFAEVLPELAEGDLVVVAGWQPYHGEVSAFLEARRFKVVEGVVESPPDPRILAETGSTLEDLRISLAGGTK